MYCLLFDCAFNFFVEATPLANQPMDANIREKPVVFAEECSRKKAATSVRSRHTGFHCLKRLIQNALTFGFISFWSWALLYGLVDDEALPGGKIFAFWLLIVGGWASGFLVEKLRMPALFGMLLWGLLLRNVPQLDFVSVLVSVENRAWSSQARNCALAVILLRAGIGIDQQALYRQKWAILTLAFVPAAAVVVTINALGFTFLQLPLLWSLLLGFVCCAVSPAVIVPLMLTLQEKQYGTSKGIPSTVIGAATICSVVAVCCFGLLLSVITSTGSLALNVVRAPVEIVAGLLYGVITGFLLWHIPKNKATNMLLVLSRSVLLGVIGIGCLTGAKAIGLSGAGVVGCVVSSYVAAHGWAKGDNQPKHQAASVVPVANVLKAAWLYVFQPVLFASIGAAVSIRQLERHVIGNALALILVAHIAQALVTFGALYLLRFKFTCQEKLFLSLAFLPKATIQAAIGSTALDLILKLKIASSPSTPVADLEMWEKYATDVLTVAVLCILATAPAAAIAVKIGGNRLLHKNLSIVDDDVGKELKSESTELLQPKNIA